MCEKGFSNGVFDKTGPTGIFYANFSSNFVFTIRGHKRRRK